VDAPGTIIAERYELVRVAGSGGMAIVWYAIQHGAAGFERPVCIKRIKEPFVHDEDFRAMFIEEARISSRLVHPNVVQIHDFGVDRDRYFLVMEWVEGLTFFRMLNLLRELERRAPWPLVAVVGVSALRGLTAAHERLGDDGLPAPVFHRDVTPQNILMSTNGQVKLTDFGLARATDRSRMTNPEIIKGKVGYLAPELANGEPASAQTDVYALGVVLWEALAGHRLYRGKNDAEIFAAVQRAEVPPLEEERDDLPRGLARVVERALARDPADRFDSADQMTRVLVRVLHDEPHRIDDKTVGRYVAGLVRFSTTGEPPSF
jgi:eukaryotic-like serine/threonine-protein kinase